MGVPYRGSHLWSGTKLRLLGTTPLRTLTRLCFLAAGHYTIPMCPRP
ncbi:hypothetical protein GMORB2_6969 [Geosmithia morbida]|uniref:Uncharacterized protein n=1 Tax=Geosmithia morbida TaxID=1094350 RepID=A0A9P4YVP1_9HYPO|nr:uncharacterized protein GMORB2_6969 [Geosmithia morbida]KAF4122662.1 hypothetical protein GMORB2_6969 [Geosmithia morbida]